MKIPYRTFLILTLLGAISATAQTNDRVVRLKAIADAKQVYFACVIYSIDNDDKFPPSLADLIPHYLSEEEIVYRKTATGKVLRWDYTKGLTSRSPAGAVLVKSRELYAGRRIIANADGTVKAEKPKKSSKE